MVDIKIVFSEVTLIRDMFATLRPGGGSVIDNVIGSSLLSLSVISTCLINSDNVSQVYVNICRASLGIVLSSWIMYFQDILNNTDTSNIKNLNYVHLGVAAVVLYIVPPDSRHNSYVVYWIIISFRPLLLWLLRKFPKSFSYAEASLLSQSVVMSAGAVVMKMMSLEKINNKILAMQVAKLLRWLEESMMENRVTVIMLLVLWTVLVILSVGVVLVYNLRGWTVTTRTRKIFHVAIVLVYWSGLQHCHLLLLVSSYAALALMLGLEMLRVTDLFPLLTRELNKALTPFLDTKDSGQLILTNIYLLAGMSLPLWLDTAAVTAGGVDSLLLYSGLVSVGVADTAAAVLGSAVGRVKWTAGGDRTVEGSLAAVISSLSAVMLLEQLGGVTVSCWWSVIAAVSAVSLSEALSNQVDNLTLPLIMMSVLNITTIITQ